jgi:hypothetical protein
MVEHVLRLPSVMVDPVSFPFRAVTVEGDGELKRRRFADG